MATKALTDQQKHLLRDFDPALQEAKLDQHLDNLTNDNRRRHGDVVVGTPTSETGGPPDFIDVPLQVNDADGAAVTERTNLRVRLFDDAAFTTPATVGNHRLTGDGTGNNGDLIGGDDSIDAVIRTEADGSALIRVEDVNGGSGATVHGLVTDGGNPSRRIEGGTFSVTFD